MRKNNGFTLVELIIVIAILAIIMLIAIPNFSGIQQRMQVRADKATAAQIGKAVRIWYTEYQSDKAMKGRITATGVVGTPGSLPAAGSTMIPLDAVKELESYVDVALKPKSLLTDAKAKETSQYYLVGITGSGTSEKIVVAIHNLNSSTYLTTLATTEPADVKYDGTYIAEPTASTTAADLLKFQQSRFAYLEP